MKVLVTGGHVTPALAVIDELNDADIVFVGRRYALRGDRSDSFEYTEVVKKGLRFRELKAGRATRLFNLTSLKNVLSIPQGFWNAYSLVREEKPDVVLSFGGYIAVPIALSAKLLGIPVVTHEQTVHPGKGNRFIASFASKVFTSFEESLKLLPNKTVVVGNPVRKEVLSVNKKIPKFTKKRPVILVIGGSLGSHSINEHIFTVLPELLKKYTVIHQTGSATEYGDDHKSKEVKDAQYFPFAHLPSEFIGHAFESADLVISRAGANTFFELLELKKPSILIPLPWSAGNEQSKHAHLLKAYGVAEIFDQDDESGTLLALVEKVFGSLENYQKNFDTIKLPYEREKAAEQIAKAVFEAGMVSRTP